jgi:hypothetical protein
MLCQVCQAPEAELYQDGAHIEPRCEFHLNHNLCQLGRVTPTGTGACSVCGSEYAIRAGKLGPFETVDESALHRDLGIVAPTPEEITGTFSCCEPCRTGHCGQECGHGALNQLGMTLQAFLDKQHDGCMCLLEGQRIV